MNYLAPAPESARRGRKARCQVLAVRRASSVSIRVLGQVEHCVVGKFQLVGRQVRLLLVGRTSLSVTPSAKKRSRSVATNKASESIFTSANDCSSSRSASCWKVMSKTHLRFFLMEPQTIHPVPGYWGAEHPGMQVSSLDSPHAKLLVQVFAWVAGHVLVDDDGRLALSNLVHIHCVAPRPDVVCEAFALAEPKQFMVCG